MKLALTNGVTSVVLRIKIPDTDADDPNAGLTGLTSGSSGLIVSTLADNEATPTAYTAAAGNIETIAALGTFAAPTAGKCRFKEVSATNHPGLYEVQIANARWAVSGATSIIITVSGAANAGQVDVEIQLDLQTSSADVLLCRDMSECEASAAAVSLCTVVLAIANKSNTIDNPGYLTVYRTNGTTEHCQIPITTDANADPIDGVG